MGKVTSWYPGWHFALLAARTWLLILTFGFIGADITCRSCRWQVQLQPQPPARGLLMNLRTARGGDGAGEIPVDKRGKPIMQQWEEETITLTHINEKKTIKREQNPGMEKKSTQQRDSADNISHAACGKFLTCSLRSLLPFVCVILTLPTACHREMNQVKISYDIKVIGQYYTWLLDVVVWFLNRPQ